MKRIVLSFNGEENPQMMRLWEKRRPYFDPRFSDRKNTGWIHQSGGQYAMCLPDEKAGAFISEARKVQGWEEEFIRIEDENSLSKGTAVSSQPGAIAMALRLWTKMALGHEGLGDVHPQDERGWPKEYKKYFHLASGVACLEQANAFASSVLDDAWEEQGQLSPDAFARKGETGTLFGWYGHWTEGRQLKLHLVEKLGSRELLASLSWNTATGFPSSWMDLPDLVLEGSDWEMSSKKGYLCPACGRPTAIWQEEKGQQAELFCTQCGARSLF